jgi:hypothetical protein
MEARAVLAIAPCYNKSRSGSQQTVIKRRMSAFADTSADPNSIIENSQ